MKVHINLSKRYTNAFGFLAQENVPAVASAEQSGAGSSYNFEFYPPIDPEFEDVSFSFPGTTVKFGTMPFNKEVTGILAPPPLLSFSSQKHLVETPINDSDNIVIERWGTSPWEIRIRGLLIDVENRHYPQNKVQQLCNLFRYNGVVDVSGTQFFDKDISSVYFKPIEINGVPGFQDTVQFTLTAKSISPVGFTLTNPL